MSKSSLHFDDIRFKKVCLPWPDVGGICGTKTCQFSKAQEYLSCPPRRPDQQAICCCHRQFFGILHRNGICNFMIVGSSEPDV